MKNQEINPNIGLTSLQVGLLDVNCYLVASKNNETLFIIDPGSEPDRIIEAVSDLSFKRAVMLLTHAHVDHIGAVKAVKDHFGAKLYLHPDDLGLYFSPDNHVLPFLAPAGDLPKPDSDFQPEGLEIIHTPGHSLGGVCFHFPEASALFTGDTLFQNSIGRTDLPGGNIEVLLKSIRNKLFVLPDDLVIYPGHGPSSTIGSEKRDNPFC